MEDNQKYDTRRYFSQIEIFLREQVKKWNLTKDLRCLLDF